MPAWQIFSGRFTLFVAPDFQPSQTLWRDLMGDDPEQSVAHKPTSTKTDKGPFAEGTLTIKVVPVRIDLVYDRAESMDEHSVGPYPTALEPFLRVIKRWISLENFPVVTRIALGLVLTSDVESLQRGYDELRQLINGVPNSPDVTDFQLQFNTRRDSNTRLDGLRINRLSKWSVGAVKMFTVTVDPSGAPIPRFGVTQHHLRLELDINTAPDFQATIPREQAEAVLDDLMLGAREVSERGIRA